MAISAEDHLSALIPIGNGILQPVLSHRFRVRYYGSSLDKEEGMAMTRQTVNFKMDFKAKTISFDIQQPACIGRLIEVVAALVEDPGTITAEIMDGNDGVLSRYEFNFLECISHALVLDYENRLDSKSNPANHELVMKYRHMRSV